MGFFPQVAVIQELFQYGSVLWGAVLQEQTAPVCIYHGQCSCQKTCSTLCSSPWSVACLKARSIFPCVEDSKGCSKDTSSHFGATWNLALFITGQFLGSAHRVHPYSTLSTKTLQHKPNTAGKRLLSTFLQEHLNSWNLALISAWEVQAMLTNIHLRQRAGNGPLNCKEHTAARKSPPPPTGPVKHPS